MNKMEDEEMNDLGMTEDEVVDLAGMNVSHFARLMVFTYKQQL